MTTSIVRRPFHHEHGGVRRDIEEFGVSGVNKSGADRLRGATNIDRQQLVETGSLHVSQRQQRTEMIRAPNRDPSERCTIGQIETSGLEDPLPQQRGHVCRGVDELEVEHLPFRGATGRGQLTLDRCQHRQALRQTVRGCEPPDALPRLNHALITQHLERFANRDPARLIRRAKIGLARQQPTGGKFAAEDAIAQIICDLGIAKRSHLY